MKVRAFVVNDRACILIAAQQIVYYDTLLFKMAKKQIISGTCKRPFFIKSKTKEKDFDGFGKMKIFGWKCMYLQFVSANISAL